MLGTIYQLRVVQNAVTESSYLRIIQLPHRTLIEYATTLTEHYVHGIVVAA